jgi:cell division protein FtsL
MKNKDKNNSQNLDGVIYTPTNKNQTKPEVERAEPTPIKQKKKMYRKRPNKSQFKIFYGITILAGLVISLSIFVMVFGAIGGRQTQQSSAGDIRDLSNEVSAQDEIMADASSNIQATGTVVRINPSIDVIVILDMATNAEHSLLIDGNTQMLNQFGGAMSLAEFRQGDIVDIEFTERSNALKKITRSASSWEHGPISGVVINDTLNTITMGSNTFSYDDTITVTYRGESANITEITPIDYVTIRGVGNTALSIDINRGHGSIQIINAQDISGGVIELNRNTIMALNDVNAIDVSEGQHRVLIRGNNIQPFTREINIVRGQVYVLDLDNVDHMSGLLTVRSNPSDITFTIDGTEVSTSQAIPLAFGQYQVRAQKENHEPWEGVLVVDRPNMVLDINLPEVQQQGRVTISTEPPGGAIYIGGGYVGVAPMTIELTHGRHDIVVRRDGYRDFETHVDIGDRPLSYNFRLHQAPPLM